MTYKPFDIFLSYKSEDAEWVQQLKKDLETRGIKVWLDKDEIRPGDHFAEALEKGLELSKTMGLVVTPESLNSNWVREEYYRAISLVNDDELRLIPILLRKAAFPGFLKGRQYVDFSNKDLYEHNLDRLIWPGITGKRIVVAWVSPVERTHCDTIRRTNFHRFVEHKLSVEIQDVSLNDTWWKRDSDRMVFYRPARHVVFINLFEDDRDKTFQYHSPQEYANFIFQLRDLTKGSNDEVVFVLYHKSDALKTTEELDSPTLKRLNHYFLIHHDESSDVLERNLHQIWNAAQKLLLDTEVYIAPQPNTIILSEVKVHAIHPNSKHVKKMKLVFTSNFSLDENDLGFFWDTDKLNVEFTGKGNLEKTNWSSDKFVTTSSEENRLIFASKGHNDIHFNRAATIQPDIHADQPDEYGIHRTTIQIEFLLDD